MRASDTGDADDTRVGKPVGGRWRLGSVIGRGATSVVYAAEDTEAKRAAVKVLQAELARRDDVRARFEREGYQGGRLRHPGLVEVFDAETREPETAYVAMELLQGATLRKRIEHGERLTVDESLDLAAQILETLAAAHAAGIVHRELDPDHVFVTRSGQIKLLDFGPTRLLAPDDTDTVIRFTGGLGAAGYRAPELARGRYAEVDARTDLFAVGALLFWFVSGRDLHTASTETELLSAMTSRAAPPLASVAPSASPGLCKMVDVSLSFDKNARYPDAQTMLRDLSLVRAGEAPAFAVRPTSAADTPGGGLAARTSPAVFEPTVLPHSPPVSNAVSEIAPDPLVGTVVAGRYKIEKLLGIGGMGTVYRAQHVYMLKTFALKVLHKQMTFVPEVVARFEREAVAAARIEHRNVAKAADFGRLEDGAFYLALEFVEGVSLRHELERCGLFVAARAVDIARQMADALAAAHAERIVHRDLKPENVMLLTRGEPRDYVKVLDFGIAKVQAEKTNNASKLTQMGSVFGTPEYMSPEQAMGQPVDHRSDLYSMGIILYEMLCGRTPFSDRSMAAVLTAQMTAEPPPLPAAIPSGLRDLVMDLLRKDPAARPQTAHELSERLNALGLSELHPPGLASAKHSRVLAALAKRSHAVVGRLERALVDLGGRVPQLARPVTLGGRSVPLGIPVAAVGLLVLFGGLLVILLSLGGEAESAVTAASGSTPSGVAPASTRPVRTTAQREEKMPRDVLNDIVATPVYKRKLEDWVTLGKGHAQYGEWPESVSAYRNALQLRGSLRSDPKILYELRQAAENVNAYQAAIGVATTLLGTAGMDLLYDLWIATKDVPEKRDIAELAHKKLEILRLRRTSKALRVRLELEFERRCPHIARTIRVAMLHADQRSLPLLESLKVRTGCGASKKRDCFECLRGNEDLDVAIATAKRRRPPVFDGETPPP